MTVINLDTGSPNCTSADSLLYFSPDGKAHQKNKTKHDFCCVLSHRPAEQVPLYTPPPLGLLYPHHVLCEFFAPSSIPSAQSKRAPCCQIHSGGMHCADLIRAARTLARRGSDKVTGYLRLAPHVLHRKKRERLSVCVRACVRERERERAREAERPWHCCCGCTEVDSV